MNCDANVCATNFQTTDLLIGLLEKNGFTLLTSELFQTDPLKAVKAVKVGMIVLGFV